MPVTSFPEYAHKIQKAVDELIASGEARLLELEVDPRSSVRGYIAGVLQFQDESELHFREYVDVSQSATRLMYAYHYQDNRNRLLFRYDNAAHRPPLLHPEHKHTPTGIELSAAPTFTEVLDEILHSLAPI